MNYRSLRVGQLIRDELAKLIVRELEFPDALVTVTDVEVSKKMDIAKVFVGVLPETREKEVLAMLADARGSLQHLLNNKLNIKPMPHVIFAIDRGSENAARVEKKFIGK